MITLEQVLKAYEYANSHPHKYLRGTSNWCAAVAHILNDQKPAAQHQGDPVAWVNGQQLRMCAKIPRYDEPENPMVHSLPRNIAGSALRTDYCNTPLYAEQPAPVAVVMPEILHQTIRDTLRNYRMSTLDDGHGGGYPLIDAMTADGQPVSGGIEECQYLADAILNACIEEVSRLNGVKP